MYILAEKSEGVIWCMYLIGIGLLAAGSGPMRRSNQIPIAMILIDEATDTRIEILDDFMCNCKLPDGSYAPTKSVFPDIQRIDHTCGYVVLKDGTIKCSTGCSSSIAQFDGCKESEIHLY